MTVEYMQDVIIENGMTTNSVEVKAKFLNTQDKINGFIKDKLLFITEKKGLRRYVSEEEKENDKLISDLLLDWGDNQDSEKEINAIFSSRVFDYTKPTRLIENLIKSYNPDDCIILDFFAGSGTTGHSVLELNSKDFDKETLVSEEIPEGNNTFILCQLNENLDEALKTATGTSKTIIENQIKICDKIKRPHELSEITAERLRRVMLGKSLDGTNDFSWLEEHTPYGGNLDVYEIESVANFASEPGQTPFDVIDETLYGEKKFKTVKEKIDWVCKNFDKTQKYLEV